MKVGCLALARLCGVMLGMYTNLGFGVFYVCDIYIYIQVMQGLYRNMQNEIMICRVVSGM